MAANPSSLTIDRVCQWLAGLAPLALAESWDNVGLLVGDRRRPAEQTRRDSPMAWGGRSAQRTTEERPG